MKRRIIALFGALAVSAAIPAAGEPDAPPAGSYRLLGGGRIPCQAFVQEMSRGPSADLVLGTTVTAWVHGYVSAYNERFRDHLEVQGDLVKGLGEPELEVMHSVIDYCADHGDKLIGEAAQALVMSLFLSRSPNSPPQQR